VGTPDSHVAYIEHLMAALAAGGITDLKVQVNGPELPLLDGSARPWVALLKEAGVAEAEGDVFPLAPAEPVVICEGEAFLSALPAGETELVYVLDHPHPLVGRQWARFRPATDDFAAEIAPARTFTTEQEARQAQAQGLLKGGSEENAIVIYPDHLSAPPGLPHAFARHKLLDLIGDLYLLGRPLRARVVAYQSGHELNHRLAQALASGEPSAA
jgi:UDP-3-O-[3-hydroxymyristoyl] N-acetylglucosamine deacetylase